MQGLLSIDTSLLCVQGLLSIDSQVYYRLDYLAVSQYYNNTPRLVGLAHRMNYLPNAAYTRTHFVGMLVCSAHVDATVL